MCGSLTSFGMTARIGKFCIFVCDTFARDTSFYYFSHLSKIETMKTPPCLILNLAASFCLFLPSATAQNIPDPNFADAIRNVCPGCIDDNNNLTSAAQDLDSLDVGGAVLDSWDISNLAGIEGFINLKFLDCSYNHLGSLPTLPASLTYLKCSHNLMSLPPTTLPASLKYLYCPYNLLNSLPDLPDSLMHLECSYNLLGWLPTLPASLKYLYCTNNQLSSLPDLPDSLTYLYCSHNPLGSLPTLPASLILLECSHNPLGSLPTLPASLTYLYCSYNQLNSLPALPDSLKYLYCTNNQLSSLPALPDKLTYWYCPYTQLNSLPALPDKLTYLNCSFTQLDSLPALPDSLKNLACFFTKLISLPALPAGLMHLSVYNTSLYCLPILPNGLKDLLTSGTQITCIPNQPDDLNMVPELPLCSEPCAPLVSTSNILAVKPFSVQPNPMSEVLQVRFSADYEGDADFILLNSNGQIVRALSGKGDVEIPVDDLPQGIYWLEVRTAGWVFGEKVLKK